MSVDLSPVLSGESGAPQLAAVLSPTDISTTAISEQDKTLLADAEFLTRAHRGAPNLLRVD